jgi:hypothetical protein
VVPEQLDDVPERLLRLPEILVDEGRNVELLVAPVDLEQRLEAPQEAVNLREGGVEHVLDDGLVVCVNRVLLDPALRVKVERLVELPRITDRLVPVLELLPVRRQ